MPSIEHALRKPFFSLMGATLVEVSFLHFRNASLLHTLTQLAVKSDVLKLSSWNLHWTSSRIVRLVWCRRRGYSIASYRATRSVSLLFRHTSYIVVTKICGFATQRTYEFFLLSFSKFVKRIFVNGIVYDCCWLRIRTVFSFMYVIVR